jgi:uncharacterized protein
MTDHARVPGMQPAGLAWREENGPRVRGARARSAGGALVLFAIAVAACSGGRCGGSATGDASSPASSIHAPPMAASPVPPSVYRIAWHQLIETDVDAAAAYYADVTGWTTRKDGEHVTCFGSSGPLAGVLRLSEEMKTGGLRPYWGVFVQVTDVDATIDQAKAHGARVVYGPAEVQGARIASFMDSTGALTSVGRWSPPLAPRDTRVSGEFIWDDLVTRDAGIAEQLLGDLFSWVKLSEVPAGKGRYALLARDGVPVAGVFADPTLAAPGWISYVHVSDLDAAIGRATRGGGAVTFGPEIAGDGRQAQLRDPQGAIFGLRESNEAKK